MTKFAVLDKENNFIPYQKYGYEDGIQETPIFNDRKDAVAYRDFIYAMEDSRRISKDESLQAEIHELNFNKA